MYQTFIGIDIGKKSFYVALYGQNTVTQYANTPSGFIDFYTAYKEHLNHALIVLETTGGYEMDLIRFLLKKHCFVHRANTRNVKHFIRSYGQLGKSDAIDAAQLARFGYERHASLVLFVERPNNPLLKLVRRRHDLLQLIVKEKNRLKAPDQHALEDSFRRVLDLLMSEIAIIDEHIKVVISQDDSLNAKKKVLQTISGVGPVISTELLAWLPELGTLNRKQVASLGGLAPHPNESGEKVGRRFTRGGRAEIKTILFMAAMTAARSQSALGDFYRRLLAAGKKKMVALTALMRKILVIANARVRDFYQGEVLKTT